MKRCSTCEIEKDENRFGKDKKSKDGLYSTCKNCRKIKSAIYYASLDKEKVSAYNKQYRISNKEALVLRDKKYYLNNKNKIHITNKKYRDNHKKEISAQKKEYAEANKDMLSIKSKEYYETNKDKIKSYQQENRKEIKEQNKRYRANNKEIIREKKRLYDAARKEERNEKLKIRRENDASFKLRQIVSRTISNFLRKNNSSKNGSSILDFLPYTISELKDHLEQQFESWMTWKNWSKYIPKIWDDNNSLTWTWQIDHIIPQSDLPYTSMTDDNFQKCWALSNLRPLSAKQNVMDGVTKIRHNK
jgi:hypothetical protein